MRKTVAIFTDGSCLGNPGPGGYGVVLKYNQHLKELAGGFKLTTNNRMELMAAIVGLESLKEDCTVVLTTDSQYVRLGITQWLKNWKRNNWRTSQKEPVKNKSPLAKPPSVVVASCALANPNANTAATVKKIFFMFYLF